MSPGLELPHVRKIQILREIVLAAEREPPLRDNLLSPENLHRAVPDRRENRAISFAIACAQEPSSMRVRCILPIVPLIGCSIPPLATFPYKLLAQNTL